MKITKDYLRQLILEQLQEAAEDPGSKVPPEEQARRLQAIMAKGNDTGKNPAVKAQEPAGSVKRPETPLETFSKAPKMLRDTFATLKKSVDNLTNSLKKAKADMEKTKHVSPWLEQEIESIYNATQEVINAKETLGATIELNLLPYIQHLQKQGTLGDVSLEEQKRKQYNKRRVK